MSDSRSATRKELKMTGMTEIMCHIVKLRKMGKEDLQEQAAFLALDPKEEGRLEARVKPLTRHSGGDRGPACAFNHAMTALLSRERGVS
jgi:hypothetical protein